MKVKRKEQDKPISRLVYQLEASYLARFDQAVKKFVIEATKKLHHDAVTGPTTPTA